VVVAPAAPRRNTVCGGARRGLAWGGVGGRVTPLPGSGCRGAIAAVGAVGGDGHLAGLAAARGCGFRGSGCRAAALIRGLHTRVVLLCVCADQLVVDGVGGPPVITSSTGASGYPLSARNFRYSPGLTPELSHPAPLRHASFGVLAYVLLNVVLSTKQTSVEERRRASFSGTL